MISLRILPLVFLVIACACSKKGPLPETEDSPARSATEELETFLIEPGFKVQLVASEPLIEDPVLIQFDENGRLWVVEMRGYMSDINGSEEDKPIGRISILEDENGDGEMDKSTIYLDNLVMPRALGLIKGGALIAENNSLWVTQDLDGDLKADTKVLLDSTYASNGVPEHSDNGFVRNVDNWY
ncbi:MAG: glucose/arabinose dehydrogenase, partial [Algoriphagus sp.]